MFHFHEKKGWICALMLALGWAGGSMGAEEKAPVPPKATPETKATAPEAAPAEEAWPSEEWVKKTLDPWLEAHPAWEWIPWSHTLLGEGPLTENDLAALATLEGLRRINLRGGAPRFGRLSPLNNGGVQIKCDFPPIPPGGLQVLGRMSALREVKLFHLDAVDDGLLEALAALPHLEAVHLGGPVGVTDAGLGHLTRASGVKTVWLMRLPAITDAGLTALGALPLTNLVLSDCPQITDQGLTPWAAPKGALQSLSLTRCPKITDAGLIALGTPTTLTELGIWEMPQLTAEGLRFIAQSPALKTVSLGKTGLDAAKLAVFRGAPALEQLFILGNETLGDDALAVLPSMPKLEYVDLSRCPRLTDAGLMALAPCPALKKVACSQVKQVTVEKVIPVEVEVEGPDGPVKQMGTRMVREVVEVINTAPGLTPEGQEAFRKRRPDVELTSSYMMD